MSFLYILAEIQSRKHNPFTHMIGLVFGEKNIEQGHCRVFVITSREVLVIEEKGEIMLESHTHTHSTHTPHTNVAIVLVLPVAQELFAVRNIGCKKKGHIEMR